MSSRLRWVSLAVACLLASPWGAGALAGLPLRLSPFLLLQALLARATLAPLAALGGVVLLLAFLRERWFCRNACPTGALCDAVSACRRRRRGWEGVPRVNEALALAGLAAAAAGAPLLAILDPLALFHGAWGFAPLGLSAAAWAGAAGLAAVLLLSLLFPRLWCARLCPLGGLQVLLASLRRAVRREGPAKTADAAPPPPEPVPALARRRLLAAASGVAAGLVVRPLAGAGDPAVLRPPGAQPGARFTTACCRCGNCVRVCPSHILRPALDPRDPWGILAPQIDFSYAFCLPSCAACGAACPSGAIAPFGVADKARLVIGTAAIRLDECLLANGKECNRCVAACEYRAIRVVGDRFESAPEVDAPLCVGCGACIVACPVGVIDVRVLPVPVTGARGTPPGRDARAGLNSFPPSRAGA